MGNFQGSIIGPITHRGQKYAPYFSPASTEKAASQGLVLPRPADRFRMKFMRAPRPKGGIAFGVATM